MDEVCGKVMLGQTCQGCESSGSPFKKARAVNQQATTKTRKNQTRIEI